jgi:hypothetical protein
MGSGVRFYVRQFSIKLLFVKGESSRQSNVESRKLKKSETAALGYCPPAATRGIGTT